MAKKNKKRNPSKSKSEQEENFSRLKRWLISKISAVGTASAFICAFISFQHVFTPVPPPFLNSYCISGQFEDCVAVLRVFFYLSMLMFMVNLSDAIYMEDAWWWEGPRAFLHNHYVIVAVALAPYQALLLVLGAMVGVSAVSSPMYLVHLLLLGISFLSFEVNRHHAYILTLSGTTLAVATALAATLYLKNGYGIWIVVVTGLVGSFYFFVTGHIIGDGKRRGGAIVV